MSKREGKIENRENRERGKEKKRKKRKERRIFEYKEKPKKF